MGEQIKAKLYTYDRRSDATLVASYDTGIRIGFHHYSGLPYTLS